MAIGDLVTLDYQYEYQNWLFGSGTAYKTTQVDGLLGLPSARTGDSERQEDHGDHAGVDLIPGRTITAAMNVLADESPTPIGGLIDMAVQKMQTSKRAAFVEYPFVTRRPGHEKRYANVRPRRCEFPSNWETAQGNAIGAFQWYATDPRWYTLAESTGALNIPNAVLFGSVVVNNLGDFADGVEPLITIPGPVTNPRIVNAQDGGRTIRIDIVVSAGQTLVIDTKNKTVFKNGVDSFDSVRADNEWFVLVPGNNTITINRDNGGASVAATVKWHHGWSSA